MVGGHKAMLRSVSLSVCLFHAPSSSTVHFKSYNYYRTPIGNPTLDVKPTGHRGVPLQSP